MSEGLKVKKSWYSWKVFQRLGVKQKYFAVEDDFETLRFELWDHALFDKQICVFIMLAFTEIFIKIVL